MKEEPDPQYLFVNYLELIIRFRLETRSLLKSIESRTKYLSIAKRIFEFVKFDI
jgi:hypothetical protein